MAHETIPVIVIAGATGTGKSALALAAARHLGGVILNADSRQVYADFPIITAQPGAAEQTAVPHRLYGFLPCREKLGAGAYANLAAGEILAAYASGTAPILVGGTGLYLQTLLSGIAPIPPVDPAVSRRWREALVEHGAPALHAVLARRDPETAARLHPNDSQRITRALEVLEGTGKPLGHWHSLPVPPPPYRLLTIIVDAALDELTPRLASRIEAMLQSGAEAEARKALRVCPDPAAPGWGGIGCAELLAFITGRTDLAACRAAWLHNTRAYAKRQITWFKRDRSAVRVQPGDRDAVMKACAAHWKRRSVFAREP